MDPGSSRKAEEVFSRLLDLEETARWKQLEDLRAEDPRTAAEAQAMLASLPAAESYFEQFRDVGEGDGPGLQGRRAGAYRIVDELGRGGMGVVYLAERDDGQFKRRVAVKFVNVLAAGGEAWRGFEREKRILAGLRHPNIAQLLDAGVSDEGTPYIVMELVEGVPIDVYCRDRNLSVADRITLFQKIAGAIDFIHRNLIVHRDIKPGNVLVTAGGEPKLLDFGISKMLPADGNAADRTAPERRLMTLNYTSPEQLRGEPVSTVSDVYSLGLLLYELLAGHPACSMDGASAVEVIRRVLEEAPPPPGAARDLDQIVMKAIRKAPAERYATAREFSADLDNYLAGRPVTAVPPSPLYRLAKWVGRNRLPAALGAVVTLLLIAAGCAVIWQMQVARRERAVAERRFNEVRKLARSILFEFHDPISKLSGATEVRRLMVARSLEYLDSLAQDARTNVDLQLELASAYTRLANVRGNPNFANLGDTQGALETYGKAAAILEAVLDGQPRHRGARVAAGQLYVLMGAQLLHAGQASASVDMKRKALTHWQQLARESPADENVIRGLAAASSEMATATDEYVDRDERLRHGNQAKTIYQKLLEARPTDPDRMRDLALIHKYLFGMCQTDAECSLEHAEAAAGLDQRRVSMTPGNAAAQLEYAQSLGLLATGWGKKSEFSKAAGYAEQSAGIRRALWKADPKDRRVRDRLAYALSQVGHFRARQRQWREALACFREAIGHAEAVAADSSAFSAWNTLGWAHKEVAEIYLKLGSGRACGEFEAASQAYRRLAAQRLEFSEAKLAELRPRLAACGRR